jgi:hypothetical protein
MQYVMFTAACVLQAPRATAAITKASQDFIAKLLFNDTVLLQEIKHKRRRQGSYLRMLTGYAA